MILTSLCVLCNLCGKNQCNKATNLFAEFYFLPQRSQRSQRESNNFNCILIIKFGFKAVPKRNLWFTNSLWRSIVIFLPICHPLYFKYFDFFPIDSKSIEFYTLTICGRSSVLEHHVANVRVVSSSLIARYFFEFITFFCAGVAQW